MNWQRLLTSPPPSTGWILGNDTVAAIRRDPKDGGLRCVAEAMPAGAVEIGPVGLQSVHREHLISVLSAVQGRLEGGGRAAVVIPTAWVRSHLFEFDELPRKQTDIDQVVSWRLKKLLPVNPADLRVSSMPQQEAAGRRPLLCLIGVERAFAELESCFSSVGVEPGLISPRVFALVGNETVDAKMIVQQEVGFLSLILTVEGIPRLLRTKPLAAVGDPESQIRGELQLAHRFIRDDMGIADDIEVLVSAENDVIRLELEKWWSACEGVTLEQARPLPEFDDRKVVEALSPAQIMPVLRVLDGAFN